MATAAPVAAPSARGRPASSRRRAADAAAPPARRRSRSSTSAAAPCRRPRRAAGRSASDRATAGAERPATRRGRVRGGRGRRGRARAAEPAADRASSGAASSRAPVGSTSAAGSPASRRDARRDPADGAGRRPEAGAVRHGPTTRGPSADAGRRGAASRPGGAAAGRRRPTAGVAPRSAGPGVGRPRSTRAASVAGAVGASAAGARAERRLARRRPRRFERERYGDARPHPAAAGRTRRPASAAVRELLRPHALPARPVEATPSSELEAFRDAHRLDRAAPGAGRLLPGARAATAAVDELWEELREASPGAELVTEGRIVTAGALADRATWPAPSRCSRRPATPPKRPRPHHLRLAYALADLYERAGDVPGPASCSAGSRASRPRASPTSPSGCDALGRERPAAGPRAIVVTPPAYGVGTSPSDRSEREERTMNVVVLCRERCRASRRARDAAVGRRVVDLRGHHPARRRRRPSPCRWSWFDAPRRRRPARRGRRGRGRRPGAAPVLPRRRRHPEPHRGGGRRVVPSQPAQAAEPAVERPGRAEAARGGAERDGDRRCATLARPAARARARARRTRSESPWTSRACSATRPRACSPTSRRASRRTTSPCPAPTSSTASSPDRPVARRCCATSQSLFDHGRLGRHRLPVDPAGRPGHRALGGGVVRAEPEVLRPDEHRRAGHRGRLQRGRHARSACSARCRASTPTSIPFIVKINHNELLTYPNKFDQIMFGTVEQAYDLGAAGVGATIYFGSDGVDPPDPGGRRGVRGGPRARHVHRAVVLPAQQRVQEGRRRLPRRRRPHRPGQPPRRHHRGRHHQAEAAREQRRLQRVQGLRQDAASSSTTS